MGAASELPGKKAPWLFLLALTWWEGHAYITCFIAWPLWLVTPRAGWPSLCTRCWLSATPHICGVLVGEVSLQSLSSDTQLTGQLTIKPATSWQSLKHCRPSGGTLLNVLKGGGPLVTGQPRVCVALVGPGSHDWFQYGLWVLSLQQNHRGDRPEKESGQGRHSKVRSGLESDCLGEKASLEGFQFYVCYLLVFTSTFNK